MTTCHKYLGLCLMLAQLVSPVNADSVSDEQKLTKLMTKLELATDCVFKAVQVCQEWDYPGKMSMESIFDYVRHDNTQEAHKHALIYQFALLLKTILTAKLMGAGPQNQARDKQLRKEVSQLLKHIEQTHVLKLYFNKQNLSSPHADIALTLPLKLFKQEAPLLVEMQMSSNAATINEGPSGAFMRLQDDKSLILRLNSRLSHEPAWLSDSIQIEIETTLLQYHGH